LQLLEIRVRPSRESSDDRYARSAKRRKASTLGALIIVDADWLLGKEIRFCGIGASTGARWSDRLPLRFALGVFLTINFSREVVTPRGKLLARARRIDRGASIFPFDIPMRAVSRLQVQ